MFEITIDSVKALVYLLLLAFISIIITAAVKYIRKHTHKYKNDDASGR